MDSVAWGLAIGFTVVAVITPRPVYIVAMLVCWLMVLAVLTSA